MIPGSYALKMVIKGKKLFSDYKRFIAKSQSSLRGLVKTPARRSSDTWHCEPVCSSVFVMI